MVPAVAMSCDRQKREKYVECLSPKQVRSSYLVQWLSMKKKVAGFKLPFESHRSRTFDLTHAR